MIQVYVATKFENKDQTRHVIARLEAAGYHVTYDWTQSEQFSQEQAIADLRGVLQADFVVVLAEQHVAYKGTYVELGAALASGTTVYLVGNGMDACVFANHPLVRRMARRSNEGAYRS